MYITGDYDYGEKQMQQICSSAKYAVNVHMG